MREKTTITPLPKTRKIICKNRKRERESLLRKAYIVSKVRRNNTADRVQQVYR
jgi:hypothetical protein